MLFISLFIFFIIKDKKVAFSIVLIINLLLIPTISTANINNSQELIIKNITLKNNSIIKNDYVSYNKQLHVEGRYLLNQYDEIIELHGMAIDNSKSLREDWYNKETIESLKNWGANVLRIPMSTATEGTNLTYIYTPELINNLYNIVDACIEEDMYAIIDWHVLSEKNPNDFWSVIEMNNIGEENNNWNESHLRHFLNSNEVLSRFNNSNYIKSVKKEFSSSYLSRTVSPIASDDKLWLLSTSEIYKAKMMTVNNEEVESWAYTLVNESSMTDNILETRYAYYAMVNIITGKTTDELKRPKTNEIEPSRGWWLRSLNYSAPGKYNYVSKEIHRVSASGLSSSQIMGIVPCFSI